MTDLQDRTDLRILYCPISLTSKSEETDLANAVALVHAAKRFTHVLIVTRPWQTTPDAIYHPTIRIAMQVCQAIDLPVIWGRWLWTGWPLDDPAAYMTGVLSHVYPAYYAAAISRLNLEKVALGAVGTMLDAEPNGHPANEDNLRNGFYTWELRHVQSAILQAVNVTGQVDFIYPAASSNPISYAWSVVGLGEKRLVHKTYGLLNADDKVIMNPPDGVEAKLDLWGHSVSTQGGALNSADVMAFDMARVRERFPENVGQWVYAAKFAEVMKGWNG